MAGKAHNPASVGSTPAPAPKIPTDCKLFWFNVPWACGGVFVSSKGIVAQTCPIFGKWKGQDFNRMKAYLKAAVVEVSCGANDRETKDRGSTLL